MTNTSPPLLLPSPDAATLRRYCAQSRKYSSSHVVHLVQIDDLGYEWAVFDIARRNILGYIDLHPNESVALQLGSILRQRPPPDYRPSAPSSKPTQQASRPQPSKARKSELTASLIKDFKL